MERKERSVWFSLEAEGPPMSGQIYEKIRSRILSGELSAGMKLPSSRKMSADLGVSRNTVLDAYEQLTAEGYLEARHGSGTRVAAGIGIAGKEEETAVTISASSVNSEKRHADHERSDLISFRSGIPALELFPKSVWAKIYKDACLSLPDEALRYGSPAGEQDLREAIAEYLSRSRGIRCGAERIMITSGSTQGLAIVSRLLRREKDHVLVEDPAHMGMIEVVARAGYAVSPVRVDADGLDTSALDTLHTRDPAIIRSTAFVYTTPSHQYPLGGILPIQRRQALLAFAEKAGCFVVEDDYDSEFRYEGRPVSSLYDLNPQRVIYLGSFSKVLAPALRLGFAILPESLVQHWKPEKMYHDVHSDSLSQHALAEFIRKGELEKHIWKARKLYKRKREALISALSSRFGSRFEIMGQAAGLHLVASFTNKVITDEIVQSLYDAGVRVRPVTRYCLESQSEHQSEVILGYSHLRFDQIERGVDILSRVLR